MYRPIDLGNNTFPDIPIEKLAVRLTDILYSYLTSDTYFSRLFNLEMGDSCEGTVSNEHFVYLLINHAVF